MTFIVSREFNQEPYITCLLDVSTGMPKSIALRAHHLEDGHIFNVDELEFYYELLKAERFAIKTLLEQLEVNANEKNASKTYMWMLGTLYKDQSKISDRVKKLVQEDINTLRNKQAESYVNSLVGENEKLDEHTFYDRFSAH